MSYATSLLMAYPPPYGPSTLLSDDLVQRSSRGTYYEPSVPYMSTSRLVSDNLPYNQIGLGPSIYHPSGFSHFPLTDYRRSSISNWQRDIPVQSSYTPLRNVREYSESLNTGSNTNTASTMAHSSDENIFNGTTNTFHNYQQNYNRLLNEGDKISHLTTLWSPKRARNFPNDEKPTSTYRSLPELSATIVQKKSPIEGSKKSATSIPPPSSPPPPPVLTKQETNLQRNPTVIEIEKQQPQLTEPPKDEKPPEEVWTHKIDHLHTMQAQREKEKAKAARALPIIKKKVDNTPRIPSFPKRDESYFDSLFDGNYYRKSSTNQQNSNSSYLQNKSTTNSLTKSKATIVPKQVSPRKAPSYEPPTINRAPPTNTTNSPKKPDVKQNPSDSVSPRENIHLNADERYREALQKIRSDRAEQQQKEITESTAKRLHYGDYIRRLTKEGSIHNVIKPSPWSDFLDTKKGNVYSLTKEEKKDLYNQSKSYGERVRNRNFALYYGSEVSLSPRRLHLFNIQNQESQLDDEAFYKPVKEDDDESDSTIKATNRNKNNNGMISDRTGRSTKNIHRSSSTSRESEEEDKYKSDLEINRKQKKKYYDSSVRTTTDESGYDETSEQQSTRMKTRDTDDNLHNVREEKTLEPSEDARYKKR